MLLIRGNTRVADIYMTEFDRIFRHFYFRDIANELAAVDEGDGKKSIFFEENDKWSVNYFNPGTLKNNRREMFFAKVQGTWSRNASAGKSVLVAVKKAIRKKTAKKAASKAASVAAVRAAKKTMAKKVGKNSAAKKVGAKKSAAQKGARR